MILNLSEIRARTVPVADYINGLEEPFRTKFLERRRTYQANEEAVSKLRVFAKEYVIIVFSAAWCKDCASNIPALAVISEGSGLEVRVFGGLKKDVLEPGHKWRIPPSPQEAETFRVDKIPLIIVADQKGIEVGRIVENPASQPTLEQELYEIIKRKQ